MGGKWVEKSLGDLIDIKHGFAFKGEFFRDEPPGDILLTPGNFANGGGFKADKFKYYGGPIPNEFVLHEGDLIVTMTDLSKNADTLGFPAVVPSSTEGIRYLHNQRLGKVVVRDKNATDSLYLHYLMCSQSYRNEIVASATGTTVKHTSPERIKRFRFQLPPLSEQCAIAHILGTLDDKIELNHRMNETLEAMARALFKSWFVDFDPVRAKSEGRDPGLPKHIADLFLDSSEDSELGEIPKGGELGIWRKSPQ
jgi:type I restriction enzyme S subunit